MKKVFGPAEHSSRLLEVESEASGKFSLCVKYERGAYHTVFIAPSDAPALALAILEAEGVESPYYNLGDAVGNLRQHVEREARHAAKAKEQAELEAEALDFLNVSREAKHLGPLGNFDDHTKDAWLAVARKAREMAKGALGA